MRHLRTAITGVAVCLVPSATCYGGDTNGKEYRYERGLAFRESPNVGNSFGHRSDENPFPGEVFYEDTDKEAVWESRDQTWRAKPKPRHGGNYGRGKTTDWDWDPCGGSGTSKSSKKSNAPSTATPVPSRSPSNSPTTKTPEPSSAPSETFAPSPASKKTKNSKKYAPCSESPSGAPNSLSGQEPGGRPAQTNFPTPGKGSSADVKEPGLNTGTCDAVQKQSMTGGLTTTAKSFFAKLDLSYNKGMITEGGILAFLNGLAALPTAKQYEGFRSVIALWVAGCEEQAVQVGKEVLGSTRRLQDLPKFEFVGLEFSLVNHPGACSGNPCEESYLGTFQIYPNTIDDDIVMKRITEAFVIFQSLLLQWAASADRGSNMQIIKVTVSDDDDFDSVISAPAAAKDTVNVATVIGATAGGLAFILLVVLLARRNHGDEEVSHLKLEEDDGADTFIREFETTASSPSRDDGYEARNVHVVGEADSIFSGWTGYTARDKSGEDMDMHDRGDVHKCSSATCEVCEQRRQQGIQFIPTGSPARPQLPSESSRFYVADDTVEL